VENQARRQHLEWMACNIVTPDLQRENNDNDDQNQLHDLIFRRYSRFTEADIRLLAELDTLPQGTLCQATPPASCVSAPGNASVMPVTSAWPPSLMAICTISGIHPPTSVAGAGSTRPGRGLSPSVSVGGRGAAGIPACRFRSSGRPGREKRAVSHQPGRRSHPASIRGLRSAHVRTLYGPTARRPDHGLSLCHSRRTRR